MCGISNGLAAFNRGTFLPITSSFFIFYLYAAPAVRMAALQGLHQIHIATHDSIGTGEDGATHQPIALPALFRAMPNLLYIRPCDSEEVAGAYIAALNAKDTPSIISLSRQNLTQYPQHSSREGVSKGAYVFYDIDKHDVTLIGVGSEMGLVMETKQRLEQVHGVVARIVSFPCQRLFEQQPREYRESVLQAQTGKPIVAIEAYAAIGWERYADASYSMRQFGKSLPSKASYEYFGFEPTKVALRVHELVSEVKERGISHLRGDFRDLNGRLGVGFEH